MQRAPVSVLRLGELVAGRYRVDALVGQGGFGAVFKAMQLPMNRPVALKVVLPHAASNAEVRARFRRETELAQRLEHPNTVRIYDYGEAEGGVPFIVWEYLNGRSLDAVIEASGPQGAARAARIGRQILKSLMEAHGKGIIHRDIKPSNIFLCDYSGERDFVKVLDFGIAKAADGQQVTRGGTMLGTPAYMSPEQVSGGAITAACDTYALGLVLAEIIGGRPVFGGDSPLGTAMAQLSDEPAPLAPEVVASQLGALIVRATQKRLGDRFATASEMLTALEQVDPTRGSEPSVPGDASAPPDGGSSESASGRARSSERDLNANAPTMSASSAPLSETADGGSMRPDAAFSIVPPTRDDPTLAPDFGGTHVEPVVPPKVVGPARAWRRALAIGAGALALALALIAFAVSRGSKSDAGSHDRDGDPRGDARSDTKADPRGEKTGRGRRLSSLGSRELRARIERFGCRVNTDSRGEPPTDTVFIASCNGEQVTVMLLRYTDATVSLGEAGLTARGYTFARDGTTVLAVSGTRSPRRLLDALR